MTYALIAVYVAACMIIASMGIMRLFLIETARRARKQQEKYLFAREIDGFDTSRDHPPVVVQIPVYNEEEYLVSTILCRLMRQEWNGPLIVQVLDDSDVGNTTHFDYKERRSMEGPLSEWIRLTVERMQPEYEKRGWELHYIHRSDRHGYKAGALENGLNQIRNRPDADRWKYVAIFDVDFDVPKQFLIELVAMRLDIDPKLACVQARWTGIDYYRNILERVQHLMMDGHFLIEQQARATLGLMFNFNGTAGVWRIAAIEDAGGWSSSTLVEDLDISYRAHLAGWKFDYVPWVECKCQVPDNIRHLRGQQYRWVRGGATALRLLLPRVLRSRESMLRKIGAVMHLSATACYPLTFALVAVTPALAMTSTSGWESVVVQVTNWTSFLLGTGSVVHMYAGASVAGPGLKRKLYNVWYTVWLLALGAGLSPLLTRAWLHGLLRDGGVFVRTPKAKSEAERHCDLKFKIFWFETVLAAILTGVTALLASRGLYSPAVFSALFAFGLGWVGVNDAVVFTFSRWWRIKHRLWRIKHRPLRIKYRLYSWMNVQRERLAKAQRLFSR